MSLFYALAAAAAVVDPSMLQRLQLAFSSSSGLLGVPGQSTYAAGGIRTDFTGGHGSWMVIDVCGIMTHGHYETKEIELWTLNARPVANS